MICSCTGNSQTNMPFKTTPTEILDESTGDLSTVKPDERSVMVSGIVPLSVEINGNPIYVNKDANSPLAFRPNFFKMVKENKASVQVEDAALKKAIKELQEKVYRNEKHGVNVIHKCFFTMVDSGFVNKATGNHDSKCRVCHKTPNQYRYIKTRVGSLLIHISALL